MEFTGERVVPWAESMRRRPDLMRDHINRYAWALPLVAGRTVVDLGCGTGYGTAIMSWLAESVIGVDCDRDSIQLASSSFTRVSFRILNLDRPDVQIPEAEVYVAFEVLEHLEAPEKLMQGLKGWLIWSLPVDSPSEFHKHVWSIREIKEIMGHRTKFWFQSRDGNITQIRGASVHSVLGVTECRGDLAPRSAAVTQAEDLIVEVIEP